MRRVLPFLSAPLVMAASVFGAGWWLRSADMLHTRLQYDAMGGPAAYVLYTAVILLGMAHLLFDRVAEAVRLLVRSRRAGRHAPSRRPLPTAASPRPVTAGPAPFRVPQRSIPTQGPPPVVRAVRRPRAPRVVTPAVSTPAMPLR